MRNLLLPVTFLSDSSFFVEYMLRLFGIEWVMLGSVVDLLFCWYNWLGKHSFDIWNLVLDCLLWTIWTEWNRRSFEDEGKTMVQLVVGVSRIVLPLCTSACKFDRISIIKQERKRERDFILSFLCFSLFDSFLEAVQQFLHLLLNLHSKSSNLLTS